MTGRCRTFARRARGSRCARRAPAALALAGAAALLAGCGGGSAATAGEPSKTFGLEIVRARFPAKQSIAKHERLILSVRNSSSETIPNIAATVDSFNYASTFPELAANKRPVWVIERGPGEPAKLPVQTQEVSVPGEARPPT